MSYTPPLPLHPPPAAFRDGDGILWTMEPGRLFNTQADRLPAAEPEFECRHGFTEPRWCGLCGREGTVPGGRDR
jgi:hypothetical protein